MRQIIRISSRRYPAAELAADGRRSAHPGDYRSGTLQAVWREEQKQLELDNLNLQANDSSLKGQASVTLEEKPKWVLNLQFDKLNLENLLPPCRPAPRTAMRADGAKPGTGIASGYLVES
jgi:hypothetical protein